MFIDIHTHIRRIVGPPRNGEPSGTAPEDAIALQDSLGIERAVILPMVSPECAYAVQSVEEIIEIAEAYPGRFIPFCNVDPRAMGNAPHAPLGELLSYYRDRGCKGVGEVTANLPFEHPLVQNLFRAVEAAGLPVTCHIAPALGGAYGLYDEPGLPQLARTLEAFPDLVYLGHSQAFWAEMGPLPDPAERAGYPKGPIDEEGVVPKMFRRFGNLYGDLAAGSGHNALARDEDFGVRFLNEFQDRLLFGTDVGVPSMPTPLPGFLTRLRDEGKISQAAFSKIARENAIRLLGL